VTATRRTLAWLAGAVVLIALVTAAGDALRPFYLSIAIAFLLDPLCDRLERLRLPRTLAVLAVMAVFALLAAGALLLLVPILVQQAVDLAANLPAYARIALEHIRGWAAAIEERTDLRILDEIRAALGPGERVLGWVNESVRGILSSGLTLGRWLIDLGIVVVVVFFLLRDFDRILARIDEWLPAEHAATLRALAGQAYDTLRGFVRGQGLVCLILGTFYAVGLSAIGLQAGLLVGFAIGLISFIPYAGATIGLVTAVGLALIEFDSWLRIGGVAAIFFVGQAIEGNFLVPVLVGERVRLHPVWVILGLYVGGVLFGFLGVLLAVPATAVLGVFARHGLQRYRESALYRGGAPEAPAETEAGSGDGPERRI
jgi:predicted PurR-regulated permease PerM